MKYLLDTHALLWYLFDSKISLWEIAIKQTRNLLQYKNSIQDIIKTKPYAWR